MADNFVTNAGAGGNTYASDDITGVHYPILKVAYGALDSATLVSTSNGFPVQQQGTWNIGTVTTLTSITNVVHVDDNAGSLTVDNAGTFAVQATIAAGATAIAKAEDAASADADVGVPAMAVRKATPVNTSNLDGDYEMLQMSAGRLWTSATIDAALPAGANAIGKLAANSGVTIGAVEIAAAQTLATVTTVSTVTNVATIGTSVTPGTAAANLGKAEDAAHASGDTGVMMLAVREATATDLSAGATDGDYEPLQVDASGRLWTHAGLVDTVTTVSTVTSLSQFAGNAINLGNGTVGTGTLRVTLASDGTGLITANPGTAANWGVYVEDAAETAGGNLMMAGAVRRDTAASSSGTTGDNSTLNTNNIGALWVAGVASTNGGWSVATGSIAATKTDIGTANTAGQVSGWYFYNPNASVAYVQFFNTQASGVTLGTTAPVYSLGIPATSAANVAPGMVGIAHATAISIAVTTTRAGSTGPGSTVDYNIWYKQ